MNNAVIYARFSPRKNAEVSESNRVQIDYCRKHAKEKGYTVIAEYEDKAISGSDEDRPALWGAIDLLRAGDVLLVYKLDRLARNVFLMELVKQGVTVCGARIEAVEGDIEGDTMEVVMVRQLLSVIAEYERNLTAVRTKTAMLQHQRNGRRMSRIPPFGYGIDPADAKRLTPIPAEQNAVERVKLLKAGGMDNLDIAKKMEGEKMYKTRSGAPWSKKQVDRILSNS